MFIRICYMVKTAYALLASMLARVSKEGFLRLAGFGVGGSSGNALGPVGSNHADSPRCAFRERVHTQPEPSVLSQSCQEASHLLLAMLTSEVFPRTYAIYVHTHIYIYIYIHLYSYFNIHTPKDSDDDHLISDRLKSR